MAIELQITGPAFSASRVLEPGDPDLILGRDADCGVCLPDPQRNVSRQHLSLRNEDDRLVFEVLSAINGIELTSGAAGPGTRGLLLAGEAFHLAGYRITISLLRAPVPVSDDPWAVLDQQSAPTPRPVVAPAEDDPFGDWGFETGFGPPPDGAADPARLVLAADLAAFFRGLGLDPQRIGLLTDGELEDMGKLVQGLVQGLLRLWQALPSDDKPAGSRLAGPDGTNPLVSTAPILAKLHYLFGGAAAHGGSMPPDRAVHLLLMQLRAHLERADDAAQAAAPQAFIPDATPPRKR